ncbi:ribose 5-phosphate isomerase B [Candidatus Aerophobetes bacterium]|nr:ribose 5-phosphate isomerase B [Candidatus Aerophobetes bacterium]
MRIAVGCDHNALEFKNAICDFLKGNNIDYRDFGVVTEDPIDYPDKAKEVAEAVARREFDRGILICGTGIGMAIAANKVRGIRAACCHDVYSAERAQKSNNAQIMTMGAFVIGIELAKMLVDAWLKSEFQAGRSAPKVEKIMQIEKEQFSN